MDVERGVVLGQRIEKAELFGNVRELFGALLQNGGDEGGIVAFGLDSLADPRLSRARERLGGHGLDVLAVEVRELFDIEDGRGLRNAGHIEGFCELVDREDLPFAAGRPAEERDVVHDRLREEALRDKILVGRVAVALGHFVVRVAHDGRAVDIARHVPAETFVQKVVLRRAGEILAAAHDVGDAHEMIVNDVCKVVGRQTVALDEHLIVEIGVRRGDVAEDLVVERRFALVGDLLADDPRHTGIETALHLFRGKIAAGIVLAGEVAGILFGLGLVAEAVIGVAALHEALGVGEIGVAPLGLDVGTDRAADVGAFVVVKTAVAQRFINDLDRALYLAGLVGVLDAEQELAVRVAGDAPGVERRAQIAHVHIPRGARRETGADLAARDALFHFLKPCIVHTDKPPKGLLSFSHLIG